MHRSSAPSGQPGRPNTAVFNPSSTNPAPQPQSRLQPVAEHDPTRNDQGETDDRVEVEEPAAEEPPVEAPPVVGPSVKGSPAKEPPAEGPPAVGPSAEGSPAKEPPAEGPPAVGPSAKGPPAEGPPVVGPSAKGPPAEGPPVVGPPTEEPPTEPLGEAEALGDVLFELNSALQVGEVSVIHPGASSFRCAAANTPGAAAAHHDEQKRHQRLHLLIQRTAWCGWLLCRSQWH
jgi:hypothetical protein